MKSYYEEEYSALQTLCWRLFLLPQKRKDYFKKLEKYENAGVREYWIFDPYKKQLVVFFFENDIYAQIYDLKQPVPIFIFKGKLQIYFDQILKWCRSFEEKQT